MIETPQDPFNWRAWHAIAVLGVMGAFLFSVRSVLNPFILFLLLVFLIQPYSGTRHHVLLVTASALLTFIWVLDTTGFLLAPFVLALVLAYIQAPLVSRMERRGAPSGLARGVVSKFNLMRSHARNHNRKISDLAHAVVRDPSILGEPASRLPSAVWRPTRPSPGRSARPGSSRTRWSTWPTSRCPSNGATSAPAPSTSGCCCAYVTTASVMMRRTAGLSNSLRRMSTTDSAPRSASSTSRPICSRSWSTPRPTAPASGRSC